MASSVCVAESGQTDVDVSCVMRHGGTRHGVYANSTISARFLSLAVNRLT